MVSKGKIAALSAVGLAVILIAGGYGVGVAKFNSAMDMAEKGIANFINEKFELSEREAVSVDFFETKESGLFSRKLNMVIADPNYNMQIPIDAKIGFLSYDFVADLKNMTVDGTNIFERYREELSNLTRLDLNGNVHWLSGKGQINFDVRDLNNLEYARRILASSSEEYDASMKDPKAFVKSKGFDEESALSVTVNINKDQEIVTTGYIKNFITYDFAMQNMEFSSTSTGFGDALSDLGNMQLVADNIYSVDYWQTYTVDHLKIDADTSSFDSQSNFDMQLNVQAQDISGIVRSVNFDFQFKDLNYLGLIELIDGSMYNPFALHNYLNDYPLSLTVQPSSKLVFIDESLQDVEFAFDGKGQTIDKQYFEGYLNIQANTDLTKLASMEPILHLFKVDGESSISNMQFKVPLQTGEADVIVNGEKVN